MAVKIEVDPRDWKRFTGLLHDMAKRGHNLKRPLTEIGLNFLRSRQFIFIQKGRGGYQDLSPQYKDWKTKKLGNPYPILRLGGALAKSITQKGGDNILHADNKNLTIGTRVKYGRYHQFGTRKMPAREFLFWGPETKKFASAKWRINFLRNMVVILYNHVLQDVDIPRSEKTARAEAMAKRIFPS